MPDCKNCKDGDGCAEGCAYWFVQELREAGFKGLIVTENGDIQEL